MKLSQASMSIRKAAALEGITDKDAEYTPFFDHANAGTPDEVKAKVNGVAITTGMMAYADAHTWKEIKQR
jgi:hypothetical protein